jgi:hypothetical protein
MRTRGLKRKLVKGVGQKAWESIERNLERIGEKLERIERNLRENRRKSSNEAQKNN